MYKAIKDYNILVCMQMPLTQPTPQFLRYPKCQLFFIRTYECSFDTCINGSV